MICSRREGSFNLLVKTSKYKAAGGKLVAIVQFPNNSGRDLNTSLMAKNTGFLLLKTLKNAGEVSYTSSLNQLLFNQSKVSLQTSGILPI